MCCSLVLYHLKVSATHWFVLEFCWIQQFIQTWFRNKPQAPPLSSLSLSLSPLSLFSPHSSFHLSLFLSLHLSLLRLSLSLSLVLCWVTWIGSSLVGHGWFIYHVVPVSTYSDLCLLNTLYPVHRHTGSSSD